MSYEIKLLKDETAIRLWLSNVGIKNYTINAKGLVDIRGDLFIRDIQLKRFLVQFGHVSGSVMVCGVGLESLQGFPRSVNGNIRLNHNKLSSTLEYLPETVNGIFDISHNRLTNLLGAPESVQSDCLVNHNELTTLEGSPDFVWGNFNCSNNQLTTLKGAPKWVGEIFTCNHNALSNLAHAPEQVTQYIEANFNPLTSLDLKTKTQMLVLHKSVLPALSVFSELDMNLWLSARHLQKHLPQTDLKTSEHMEWKQGTIKCHSKVLNALQLNHYLEKSLSISETKKRKMKI